MDSTRASKRGLCPWSIAAVLSIAATLGFLVYAGCRGRLERAALSPDEVLAKRPELALERTPEFDYAPPAPGSYELPVIQPAGDGEVVGPDGETRRLSEVIEGRIALLSFIYTRCADPTACPRATGMLWQVRAFSEEDPALAKNLRLVSLSFDPEHDTPEVMASYSRPYRGGGDGSDWLFLTARSSKELAPILDQYGQLVERKKDPGDAYGPLNHPVRVYLIDRRGRIRNIYSLGLLDPRLVAVDVRTLLIEEARERAEGSRGEA